jgi:hypothetical protein
MAKPVPNSGSGLDHASASSATLISPALVRRVSQA